MNTVATTAVPLIAHPSPIDVAANEISGGHIGRGVVRRKCSADPVLPLWAGKAGFGVLHATQVNRTCSTSTLF